MGSSTDPSGINILNLLPGGLLKARKIQDLGGASTSYFNFNGGTLSPSTNDNAATFMQGLDNAQVLGGGAVIDTAGFSIAIGQSLMNDGMDEDGGLTKQGSGTLYLNGNSSYTNTTHVNGGVLAGTGSLMSPVAVASSGALGAGPSATVTGTLSIYNTVTFAGGSSAAMRVSKIGGGTFSDNIGGISTMHYGGTLVVTTNVDMTDVFAIGDVFTLFSATTYTGSFASYNLPALPSGMAWDTSQLVTNGSIQIVTGPAGPLVFNPVVVQSGGSLVLSGSGGTALGDYRVYASTNLALPSSWIPIATNQFDSSGDFIFTNTINPANPAQFFEISNP
jgi:autotransporter-associated beta strand protein